MPEIFFFTIHQSAGSIGPGGKALGVCGRVRACAGVCGRVRACAAKYTYVEVI